MLIMLIKIRFKEASDTKQVDFEKS